MRLFVKTPETRDEIVKLQREAFNGIERAPNGIIHDIYGQPETQVYIVRGQTVDTEIPPLVGYAFVTKKLNVGFDDEPYIWSIAVRPESRKQGVGGYLLDEIACAAREEAYAGTILICKADNDAATSVYRKHEYEGVRLLKRYYITGDGLLMRRKLQ
jgi:ribosomal-protein-alanine N-acetyltransferase